jgi:peptide-methionine (S)-S-oxide reductase
MPYTIKTKKIMAALNAILTTNGRNSPPSGIDAERRHIITIPQSGDIVTLENLKFIPQDGFVPEPLFDLEGCTGSSSSCDDTHNNDDDANHHTTTTTTTTFVLDGGHYLPGLHTLLHDCTVNSTITNVSIDAGYGHYRSDLLFHVPISKLSSHTSSSSSSSAPDIDTTHHQQQQLHKVGMILRLKENGMMVRIKDIINHGTTIVLDANSPLAGTSYDCSFTLKHIDRIDNPTIPKNIVTNNSIEIDPNNSLLSTPSSMGQYEIATFALGCFWGSELLFMRVHGVVGTRVGYTNGITHSPTYQDVCSGKTQHREAVQIIYDTNIISYTELMSIAVERLRVTATSSKIGSYEIHQLFRQRSDSDEPKETYQYRHGFYYHTMKQRDAALELLKCNDDDDNDNDSYIQRYQIEICPIKIFWEAEEYHQQYLYKGGQSTRKGCKDVIRCYG